MTSRHSTQDPEKEPQLAPLHPANLGEFRSELLRAGVERILAQALEVEAELHISRHREERDSAGKRLVVRNGYLPTREITCAAGSIRIRQPRVHDARTDAHGRRHRFSSTVLPAYARSTTCIGRPGEDVFFHGLAIGDLSRAFQAIFGSIIHELPQSFLPRMRELWEADRERLTRRTYQGQDFAEVWADAVPLPADSGEPGLCSLITAATMPDGLAVLEVRHGRPDREDAWSDLFATLVARGFSLYEDRLHGSMADVARGAFSKLARRHFS